MKEVGWVDRRRRKKKRFIAAFHVLGGGFWE